MTIRLRRLFHSPVFLLGLTAFLTAFVVQSGELGTSDTTHRLQATHSFWTSEPPGFTEEYPEFGRHGRNGKLYGSYGMGQSLLMLPSDVVGTYAARLPIFRDYGGTDPAVRSIVWKTGMALVAVSVVVQLSSVVFWCPLERYQLKCKNRFPPHYMSATHLA